MHKGFADLSLTTWVRRRHCMRTHYNQSAESLVEEWGGENGLLVVSDRFFQKSGQEL